jgi:hypothetical protein
MAQRLFRYCRERGCNERTNNANGWCDKHQNDNSYQRSRAAYQANRKHDPVWKLYRCVQWTKRFRNHFLASGNVICQRIIDGQRCNRPVDDLHHLISPRVRPDLMYSPQNVVGLCEGHHITTEGTPHWKPNVDYVPTIWREIKF